jgi:hypothetical protein
MTSFFPSRTAVATLPSYATASALPVTATLGDLASVQDTASVWVYVASGWVMVASGINLAATGTAVLSGGTCTIDGGNASYSISDGFGIYTDYSVSPHQSFIVRWSGLSNIPVNNTRPNTYIAIDKTGALYESGTELTTSDERDYFYLAGYTQVAGTILGIKSAPVLGIAPANQINDILRAIGVFKVSGLTFSGLAGTLTLARSAGVLFDRSNNWKNSEKNPHQVSIASQSPLQFKRVTQTTINQTNFTTLDVGNYDNAGTVTAIGGSSNQAQNMRVYQFGTGTVYVQYGEQIYSTLGAAVAGIASENFVVNPVASPDNAVLVCIISVIKGATDLSNTTQAIFHLAGKFGDQGGGASGSTASVTLQQAYDNSAQPEIQTTLAGGALQLRRGTTAVAGDVLTIESQAGSRVAGISDTGALTIGTGTGVLKSDASGNVTSSTIVDADVSGSAAIAGTKISPDFGSQNVQTTGSLNGFAVNVQTVNATDMFGSIDATTVGGTLSIGTANAATINVGTGPGATAINLGGTGDTVTIAGTLTTVNTTNLDVTDKLITINKGGASSSGGGSGIEVDENGSATGYAKVNSGRTGWQLKGPSTGIFELQGSGSDTVLLASSTAPRTHTLPDVTGTLVSTGSTGVVTSTMILDGTITNADVSGGAAIDGTKIVSASGSVAGVVTTGTQTLAGDKTLSGVTAVSNTTATTSSTTGALVVSGGVGVAGNINTAGGSLNVGINRAGAGTAALSLIAQAGGTGADASLSRASGANGNLTLTNSGTGTMSVVNAAGTGTGDGVLVQGLRTSTVLTTAVGANYGAAAGYIGEAKNNSAGAVSLAVSGTTYNITTLSLEAGVWLISGQCAINTAGTTRTETVVSISLSSAAIDTGFYANNPNPGNTLASYLAPRPRIFVTTTTQTVYLVANCTYTGAAPSTVANTGILTAVRLA